MSLRRRKGAFAPPNQAPASPAAASSKRPTSSSRPQARPSRGKLVFVGAPLLLLWYLVFAKRFLGGPKTLPKHFAVCSSSRPFYGIVTMDETDPSTLRTQCVVFNDGMVVGRGSVDEMRMEWGDLATLGSGKGRLGGARVYYLREGETMLPGLIDAHAHVLQYGEAKSSADLVGATSVSEIVERIASFIERNPRVKNDRSAFILGLGWDQTKFSDTNGAFPTAANLDQDPRLRGRPIYLKRIDVHALWVSPAILALLPSDLPNDVPGGEIVQLADGRPSGIFLDNAMQYILDVIPPWTPLSRLSFLRRTTQDMLAAGLTGVHDAALSPADVAFLRTLDQGEPLAGEQNRKRTKGELSRLPVRIYGMVGCEPTNAWCGDEIERYGGERFTVRAAKIFTDGALGSWGAAMHEPYSDAPEKKGFLISPAEAIQPLVERWVAKGFQVNSHGIGDRANTVVIDAYEAVLRNLTAQRTGRVENEVTDEEIRETQRELRLRNEHTQILTPVDIERMGRLGIRASFQPTHCTSDMAYAESRLGPERIKGAYAWRSLLNAGVPYALGSDFPVEGVNPFLGIAAAVTRKWVEGDRAGGSPHGEGGWYPSERLTPLEALRGFTTLAAAASFSEDKVGSLSYGKLGDFIIVDGDPLVLGTPVEGESVEEMRERERRLREIKVRATVVQGRLVYGEL
ncbi:hypothetical protein JCM8547_001419 [Rhodosporidiobolus lusitaniae]